MEKRFSVWVDGGGMNDNYLTKKEAESFADKCRATGYDDVVIEEMKGSIKASDFIEWYFSDEDDTLNIGREVIANLKSTGSHTVTVKGLFDTCGYIPEHICTIFGEVDKEESFLEFETNDLIFIDDLTEVKECHKCHQEYTGDISFCPNCLTCVS